MRGVCTKGNIYNVLPVLDSGRKAKFFNIPTLRGIGTKGIIFKDLSVCVSGSKAIFFLNSPSYVVVVRKRKFSKFSMCLLVVRRRNFSSPERAW